MYKQDLTINLVTLGCSKNTVDSEKLLKQLQINGFNISHNSDKFSDIVIINTCGFILDAKKESIDTILMYCDAKEQGLIKKIYVIGCLSQRYKLSLKQEIPLVDKFYGVNEQDKILISLGAALKSDHLNRRFLTTPGHYAYMKVSDGCNRKCSFCAIPMIKGKHSSFPLEDLIDEARSLEESGVKELILIAQDITAYGIDLYNKKMLMSLVNELSKFQGFEWIRVHYAYPEGLQLEELTSLLTDNQKVCRYIDIPFQHINQRILKSMRRGYGKKEVYESLNYLKNIIPDIAVRTTLITGYPGETEKEFLEMYDFVKEMKFDRLGVFTYSHEEDTFAGKTLKDNIPSRIKTQRMEDIMELQQSISYEKNKNKIGNYYKVIIDGIEGDYFHGRTEHDSPDIDNEVLIPVSQNLQIGEFYTIKITDAMEFDLVGSREGVTLPQDHVIQR